MKKFEDPNKVNGIYAFVLKNAQNTSDDIINLIADSGLDEGGILFVHGPERSGKSIVAISLFNKLPNTKLSGRKVFFCQPLVNRPDVPKEKIVSRSGISMPVFSFANKSDIEKLFHENDIVIIDEIQFTPAELQSFLIREMKIFVERGGWVISMGLLYNSQGGEFIISDLLTERAIKIYNLYSMCQMCGRKAYKYSQRLINNKIAAIEEPELLPPSSVVSYEPRCEDCFVVKR